MRHRLAVAAVVALAGGFAFSAPGAAQTPPDDTESWGEIIEGGAQVGVFQPSSQPGNQGSGGNGRANAGNVVCEYTIRKGSGDLDFTVAQATFEYTATGNSPVSVDWVCRDGGEIVGSGNIQWTPPQGDLVDPARLAELARDRLALPAPSGDVSPSLGVGTQAQMATYFWLDNWPGAGALPSASATAGGVTVTATARPVSHTWWIRDSVRGTFPVRCGASAGESYSGTGPPPGGTCNWKPQHSSAGQASRHAGTGEPCFAATVTVVWNVTWSGGNLGPLPTHANTCIVVHEIQAVVSGS